MMKILRSLALLFCLYFCHASSAATLAILQKDGEVYSMSADSEASVSQPKRIAQLPAEGCDFVDACGAPGQLFALRADGAVFTISPDGKVEPYVVSGWDDRISRILFHDGNLYGMDLNLDKRSTPQVRILDQSGSPMLDIRMSSPESGQDFGISGQGNPVFLSVSDRPSDETYPHVTWAYIFSPGYRGPIVGSIQYLNFSSRLPGILIRARGEEFHAISEKQDTGESLWQIMHQDQTGAPVRVMTGDPLPAGVVGMEFSGENAIFLARSDGVMELLNFKLNEDKQADLIFQSELPLKDVVGMGVLN